MTQKEISDYIEYISSNDFKLVFCEKMTGTNKLWNYKKHSHSYLEVIYFLNGNISIETNGDQINVSTYNILFYPPYLEHLEHKNSDTNQEVIALGIEVGTTYSVHESFKTTDSNSIFKFLFEQIFTQYNSKAQKTPDLCKLYIQALFYTSFQRFTDNTKNQYDPVNLVSDYINNNYNKPITITELASLSSVSTSYLNRVFNQKVNSTPIKYLNKVRVKVAKQLLRSSTLTVNEISQQVGYSNTNYFWRVFKHLTNMSPTEYKKLNS